MSSKSQKSPQGESKVQGEGDYDAAKRYRQRAETFARHANTEKIAEEAAPKSQDEARELKEAEREGRSHAKGGGEPK